MNAAQKILQELTEQPWLAVKVDHLAFTFKISELRHCSRAGFMGYTSKTQPHFPKVPKIDALEGKTLEEIEISKQKQHAVLADYYERTLKIFTEHVLGLKMSPLRGRGLHGYKDSMILRNDKGIECGYVGIGGQLDTVFFQISGTGCKYVFAHSTPFRIHHWLYKVLSVERLSRLDLCVDDYDGNFDCEYAKKAYIDDWFRTSDRGNKPAFGEANKYTFNDNLEKVYAQEMVTIGSRTSLTYWRVYNKKLEQGIVDDKFIWYRSEAELKKIHVSALLDIPATFAGINQFAQSIEPTKGKKQVSTKQVKAPCLELAGRVRWFRRMAGRALVDIVEILDGDISKAFGLIVPDDFEGGKIGIPPTYKQLINTITEN